MARIASRPPEVALPVAALAGIQRALAEQVDADAAARALQVAGHAAGDALHALLASGTSEPDAGAAVASYWRRLAELFSARGWGHLVHEAVHAGVGALESTDWAEADAMAGALRPSCHFTTGLLANLLGGTAGGPVAVLEVECRARGDLRCRFLFGGEEALHAVHGAMVEGASADDTLAALR
jgi:predicted hydrocarbon binding protein